MENPPIGFLDHGSAWLSNHLFIKKQPLRTSIRYFLPISKDKGEHTRLQQCKIYHPSVAALKPHSQVCNMPTVAGEHSSDEEDGDSLEQVEIQEGAPLIKIFEMVQNSAFEETED